MTKVVNLTPHAINLVSDAGTVIIEKSGKIARVSVERKQVGTIEIDGLSFPKNKNVFGEITDLPDIEDGTLFIVSAIVANACPHRDDLIIVDDAVRNDAGQIIGARAVAIV